MKILVFDDDSKNREAAKAQLKGHDLTVVGTYDEAQELLLPKHDWEKQEQLLNEQFGDFNFFNSQDEEKKNLYKAAQEVALEQTTTYPDFDIVLADLLVPASGQSQGRSMLVGQEMSVGIFIGLLAAVKAGAKYVAVFTDSDHHSHPASACFDAFNAGETHPTPFKVEGCKVLLSNTRNWIGEFDPSDFSKELEYEEYEKRSDTVRAKNWAALLKYLLEQ